MHYWKNAKVLVTGGAGFIGSHLVEFLVEEGAKVTVVDNLERGKFENLKNVEKDINFIKIDLRNLDNCKEVCKGQEVVFNMAAKVTGIEYNITHHKNIFENNILLQIFPLKAAHEMGVQRFCQVSTACVYPHDATVPTPESEGTRGEPEPTNSGYGWAKRMGERLAEYYAQETDMEIVIVRPFNAYGPRDYYDEKTSHVIPALIKKVMDGNNPVVVWGSGNQSRVFVHAKDFAKGIMLVTERYTKADPVNIGHDEETKIKDLLKKIQDMTGIHNEVFYDTTKPEGHLRRAADITKLRNATNGLIPFISLEEGLEEMIQWYKRKSKRK